MLQAMSITKRWLVTRHPLPGAALKRRHNRVADTQQIKGAPLFGSSAQYHLHEALNQVSGCGLQCFGVFLQNGGGQQALRINLQNGGALVLGRAKGRDESSSNLHWVSHLLHRVGNARLCLYNESVRMRARLAGEAIPLHCESRPFFAPAHPGQHAMHIRTTGGVLAGRKDRQCAARCSNGAYKIEE